jgi:hypothetical protein
MFFENAWSLARNYKKLKFNVEIKENGTLNVTFLSWYDNEIEEEITVDSYDSDVIDLLHSMMPGKRLFEEEDAEECFSILKKKTGMYLFSGYPTDDGFKIYLNTQFNSDVEFYSYCFNRDKYTNFYTRELLDIGLMSPFQLFSRELKKLGYVIKSFTSSETDDEGYTYTTFRLKSKEGEYFYFDYPQPDADFYEEKNEVLESHGNNDNTLLDIMVAIEEDDFEDFFRQSIYTLD